MQTRFAFAGFRHGHIFDLLTGVTERADTEVVACCEEDAGTRAELSASGKITVTHTDFAAMLRDVPCDVIAIGDYYSRRGAMVLAALDAGKHVLSDKPICTTLEEQSEIERLASTRGLLVGAQLDCRGYAAFRKLREVIRGGELGEVCTLRIDGQHPLLPGKRPEWYFEPGKHGGTINDIGIHVFDFVPWLTGFSWRELVSARSWNAKAADFPHFEDCAQFMATLSNGAGVLADLSYLAPDQLGYQLPHYWHLLVHGTRGLAETHLTASEVTLIRDHDSSPQHLAAVQSLVRPYLSDFLNELRGATEPIDLTSSDCLRASRLALEAQSRAALSK